MRRRKRKRKDEIEDLDKRIKILLWEEYGNTLSNLEKIGNGVVNEFKPWTPLKLLALSYFIGPYLRIIKGLEDRFGPTKVFYIDIFAGCGLNKVNDTLFAGSPLITIDGANKCERKFDLMFFNDLNYGNVLRERIKSLNSLLPWLRNRVLVYKDDANKVLPLIVNDYINKEKYKNYLAFIDPYRSEIKWSALEKLLKIKYGDLFITCQARSIAREIGGCRKGFKKQVCKEISDYFGERPHVWLKFESEEDVRDFYINRINQFKPFVEYITIKGGKVGKGFEYVLIFASGDEKPEWESIIRNLKRKVEKYSGDLVKASVDWLTGKQLRVDDYVKEDLSRWIS